MEYLKTDRAFIFSKIHFCPSLGKKSINSISFCHKFFSEIIENENYCYWYFTTNPISGKILILELWAKML